MLEQAQNPSANIPPRPKDTMEEIDILAPLLVPVAQEPKGFMSWLDKVDSDASRAFRHYFYVFVWYWIWAIVFLGLGFLHLQG